MIDKIGLYIDYVSKLFDRFKTFVFIVLACIIIFYIVTGKISRNQAIKSATELAEQISGFDLEKDILIGEKINLKSERDSLIEENYKIKEQRDSVLILKDQEAWRSAKYRRERNEARRALKEYTPNDSYEFLQEEGYPFTGEKEYGFNAKQVSGIHGTFIENEFNKDIIESQTAEIDFCNNALAATKEIETLGDEVSKSFEEEIEVDSVMMAIEEEKTELLLDEMEKKRRKDRWGKVWNVTKNVLSFIGGVVVGNVTSK